MIRFTGGRGERGQVAGIEALPFGLLVFVAGALLVVNAWAVVDTKFAVDAAAREAARHVVETADVETSRATLESGATELARDTLRDHGRNGPVSVALRTDTGGFERCARVTVTVETEVPAVRIPFVGGYGDLFAIRATHSELVDPNRSGVDGRADCIG